MLQCWLFQDIVLSQQLLLVRCRLETMKLLNLHYCWYGLLTAWKPDNLSCFAMAFCIYIFNLCITHKISFKVIFLEHVPAKWPVSDIVASQSTWCSRAVRALPAIPEGPSNHRPHISYISFYISAFTKVLHKMIIYLFIHCTLYVPCTVSKMKYQ